MSFLFLFSYVLLFHFDPIEPSHPSLHPTEFLLIIVATCMLLEEIRVVRKRTKVWLRLILFYI